MSQTVTICSHINVTPSFGWQTIITRYSNLGKGVNVAVVWREGKEFTYKEIGPKKKIIFVVAKCRLNVDNFHV